MTCYDQKTFLYDYSAIQILLINLTKKLMRPFEQKEVGILDQMKWTKKTMQKYLTLRTKVQKGST